jgi:hypothetical protein
LEFRLISQVITTYRLENGNATQKFPIRWNPMTDAETTYSREDHGGRPYPIEKLPQERNLLRLLATMEGMGRA